MTETQQNLEGIRVSERETNFTFPLVKVLNLPNTQRFCFVGWGMFGGVVREAIKIHQNDGGLILEVVRGEAKPRRKAACAKDLIISPGRAAQDVYDYLSRGKPLVVSQEIVHLNSPALLPGGFAFYFDEKGRLQPSGREVAWYKKPDDRFIKVNPDEDGFEIKSERGFTLALYPRGLYPTRGNESFYYNAPSPLFTSPFDLALACILAAEIGENGKPRYSPSEYLRAADIFAKECEPLRTCFTGGFLKRRVFSLETFRKNQREILQQARIEISHML